LKTHPHSLGRAWYHRADPVFKYRARAIPFYLCQEGLSALSVSGQGQQEPLGKYLDIFGADQTLGYIAVLVYIHVFFNAVDILPSDGSQLILATNPSLPLDIAQLRSFLTSAVMSAVTSLAGFVLICLFLLKFLYIS
jgi:hypothetical protein